MEIKFHKIQIVKFAFFKWIFEIHKIQMVKFALFHLEIAFPNPNLTLLTPFFSASFFLNKILAHFTSNMVNQ